MLSKQRKRVFVVEIEKRQIVRKTSEARIIICADCRAESDFISLRQAASMFEIEEKQIFDFIGANQSHYKTGEQGEVFICLNSFVEGINNKKSNSKIKLLGANNEKRQ